MAEKNTYQSQANELSNKLWAIANDLRGNMDSSKFKNYILGIIFNEAEHITGADIEHNKERSCVYRLGNGAIRQMVIELFNYVGEDILIDAIV